MAVARTHVEAKDRIVFAHAIQGMLGRLPPALLHGPLREDLRAAGLDLDKPFLPGYPFPTFVAAVRLTAQAAFPELPREQALYQLGRRLVDGYWETLVGKALLAVLKLIGPRRALLRTEKNFRSANNYTECRFKELGPSEFEMWLNEANGEPSYTAGIVSGGLEAAGARDAQVSVLAKQDDGTLFHVKWG
ncbi:MAG: DUF2378 family protein [Deltaproteobacteria bacterium]|nr:DUF2378 family protein [Deltaproteobacteria bacterium]